jgi:hypothetical protein
MGIGSCIRLGLSLCSCRPEIDDEAVPRAPEGFITAPIPANNIGVRAAVGVTPRVEKAARRGVVDDEALFVFILFLIVVGPAAGELNALKGNVPILLETA